MAASPVALTDSEKRFLGSVIRWLLLLMAAPLIRGHVVNTDILNPAIDDLILQITGWLMAGGVLVWSVLQKWLVSKKIEVALKLPAGSTEADVNNVVRKTNPGLTKIPL